jgi:hypothetical protein
MPSTLVKTCLMLNPSTTLMTSLSLLALLLASCAPAVVTTQSPTQPLATPLVIEPSATPTLSVATEGSAVEGLTEAIAPTPFPVATSRGPNLEATDPRTVNLASGGLQFVEFFRFT